MSELSSWAYLSRVVEGPSAHLQAFLAAGKSADELAWAIRNREEWLGPLLATTASRHEWDRAAEDLHILDALGGRLLTPEHPEWPGEELGRAFGYCATGTSPHLRSYQEDAVAPHALWVRGEGNLAQLVAQAVAVVGTRTVSSYGTQATKLLVAGLAAHQWTIVSGGALGVDTVAHAEAIEQGGTTVCVAACGIDRSYPSRNARLFDVIAQHGVIVSEYPPGTAPQRHRFLTRNRLVAALAQGSVVVEAAWRSGALNTLSWASALGRVAMAVPGPITTVGSLGCHERIRNHEAELVCSAEEVRSLVSKVGEVDVGKQYEIDFAATPIQALSRNELRVFDALAGDPATATEVAQEAGMTVALCVHLLVELQGRGLVSREGSRWRREVRVA